MTDQTLNDVIRDHAMLVSVHIRHWAGEARDREASAAAAAASGADGADAYKSVKNLMYKHDARLRDVQKAGNALRALHNELTMAWDAGKSPFRMLPVMQFDVYTKTIGKAKTAYDAKLKLFLDNYLTDASAARRALNIDQDPSAHRLYPSESTVAERFGVDLTFEPIPAGSSFRNIPGSAVKALAGAHERRVTQRYAAALHGAKCEALEQLKHLRQCLAQPNEDDKALRWKDSAVTNVRDSARILKTFDLKGDEVLTAWCDKVCRLLDPLNKKQITFLRSKEAADDRLAMRDDITPLESEMEDMLGNEE